jgi:hypothetical protein
MRTSTKTLSNSTIYDRISAIRMSKGERAATIAAMNEGEKIAEAILSVAHVLRLLVAIPTLKPNFKSQKHSFGH